MDLIDRQALIERIEELYCKECNSYNGVRCRACGTGDAIEMIESAPTVEPKRGECNTCGWHNACNWETLMKDWNIEHGYCAAYCGADMRPREQEE